jgi:hypothetical protein
MAPKINYRKSKQNMAESIVFILLVGPEGLCPNNQLEIKWAKEYHKPIIVVYFEDSDIKETQTVLANYSPVEYLQMPDHDVEKYASILLLPIIEKYRILAEIFLN